MCWLGRGRSEERVNSRRMWIKEGVGIGRVWNLGWQGHAELMCKSSEGCEYILTFHN